MPKLLTLLFITCLSFALYNRASAVGMDTFRLHTDLVVLNVDGDLAQNIFYSTDTFFEGSLRLHFFRYGNKGDSLLLLDLKGMPVSCKKGVHTIDLNYKKLADSVYCNPEFVEVLKKMKTVPPGSYKTYIEVVSGGKTFQTILIENVDTALALNSPIRQATNKNLLSKQPKILGLFASNNYVKSATQAGAAISNATGKLNKYAKANGLTPVYYKRNGTSVIDYYYKNWFVGRYEARSNESISQKVKDQENSLSGNVSALTTNDLDMHPSLFSQFRSLKKDKKDNQQMQGEISVAGNFGNGQEPYSTLNNNYYEIRGMLEVPVKDMPVDVEGYYTSQDANRQAKASYVHIHYDVDKAKEQLSQLMNSYKSKYSETVSKGAGMQMVYQTSLNNLQSEESNLKTSLQNKLQLPQIPSGGINFDSLKNVAAQQALKDTAALKGKLADHADSNTAVNGTTKEEAALMKRQQAIKDSVDNRYKQLQAEYIRLLALEQKIQKYSTLLNQYKNTTYFDSAMVYSRINNANNTSDLSYRQMAREADNLLPEGKVKSFASGITNFDAGMFPKYESQFTMGGQMMKGVSFGYDLGICKTAITVGSTQYIGRDGSVDKYTTYSGKATFQPYKGEDVSLIYYGYTPSRQLLSSDNFYKDLGISNPSFKEPVHIVSVAYKGNIARYVSLDAEAATTIKKGDSTGIANASSMDRMAFMFGATGIVPRSNINIDAAYSKAGREFENNTLPLSPAGTEQIKLAAKTDFFHHILAVGIDYNYILQSTFSSSAGNRRWGFNVRTNTKRYPSLSLSYKPFTTFQSISDTFNVPQRPLIGAVWTGQASYQVKLKEKSRSLRFMAVYNKSTSSMDTSKYGTDMVQLMAIYMTGRTSLTGSLGNIQLSGVTAPVGTTITVPNNTDFISGNISYMLSKQLTVNGGQDIGFASFGLCKYALNGGMMYRFKNRPFIVRCMLRYMTYELNAGQPWTPLLSGNMEVTWQFKCKLLSNIK